ncbi:MAG: hypothetical protein IPJ86_06260 [Bacteroidetes bacterium]|nr:hypothetical protein [Bacteroidota bacterium]
MCLVEAEERFHGSSSVDDKKVVVFDITDLGNGEFEGTHCKFKGRRVPFAYEGTVPNIYSAQAHQRSTISLFSLNYQKM